MTEPEPALSAERIESIRRGIEDARTGRTRSLDVVLAELGLEDE